MSNKTLRIYLAAAILAAVVGFYVYSHWQGGGNPFSGIRGRNFNTSPFDVPIARFRCAETLRDAKSPELVAEVQQVIDQNGLPADVFFDDGQLITNLAVTLHNLFHTYYDPGKNDGSLEQLWEASPNIDESVLAKVRTPLNRLEPKRQTIRSELLNRDTRFDYILIYPDTMNTWDDVGITVNTEATRYLPDYALLEEYAIAQALLEGNVNEAINALAYMFRIAQLVSRLGNVAARSDAALVRLSALDMMQRVILDPKFNRTHMVELHNILTEQHEDWTSEHVTWFGDRASGILLYHRLMLNLPVDVLEAADYNELKSRGLVREIRPGEFEPGIFDLGFEKYHEADHAFYLRAMQQILDISEIPFAKRQDVLNQINEELLGKKETYDSDKVAMEPFVAHLLLKDVSDLMRFFARDETALNRALVLTQRSLGQSNTDHYRNTFIDEPFEVHKEDGFLSITLPELSSFRVPVFTERE